MYNNTHSCYAIVKCEKESVFVITKIHLVERVNGTRKVDSMKVVKTHKKNYPTSSVKQHLRVSFNQ